MDPAGCPSTSAIFLDCDGVLANARSQLWDFDEGDTTLLHDPAGEIVPLERRCLTELQRVVETTGASIVLSTTWRVKPEMRAFLCSALMPFTKDVHDTPQMHDRGAEVAAWLAANPHVSSYVILDDGHEDAFARAGLSDHFVQTLMRVPDDASAEGLTAAKADAAIALLGEVDIVTKRSCRGHGQAEARPGRQGPLGFAAGEASA